MQLNVDLTNCDREPIHLLGRVQGFGFLVATNESWTISHVSANAADYCGTQAQDLIGMPVVQLVPVATLHAIRNRLQFLRPRHGVEVIYDVELVGTENLFDVSVHILDGSIIMEFEPAVTENAAFTDIANVRTAIDRMTELDGLEAIFSHAVRFMKMITGYDRVMLYRFLADDSGEVVAEARRHDMEPFLKLRYPASDIPKQARALYVENPIRVISDSHETGVPVLAAPAADGVLKPFDLSGSRLRSVSPIHLEYLRNMGVGASMSISVIVEGKLWGLIACHHSVPHVPSMRDRNAALLFGQMFSLIVQTQLTAQERKNDEDVSRLTTEISKTLSSYSTAPELLKSSAKAFSELLQADGYAVVQEDDVSTGGTVPDHADILWLSQQLNAGPGKEVFATHQLSEFWPEAGRFSAKASGVLSIPISRSPRDYILFFRKELVQQVRWAGNPDKAVTAASNSSRLQPRKSFQAWQAIVENTSEQWLPYDLRAASQLRVILLEVVLRLTDEAGRERKIATERQELLIAELNHRVRNILGLVRGLISQSNSGTGTTADFVHKLDSRVQALARAHDQITQQNWSPAPFSKLVATEAESYLLEKKDRVIIEGADVLLVPQAFSSMALVVHELITNSAKYGALSDARGFVNIGLSVGEDGALKIVWRESGGPSVEPPTRRGFGSAIVERTIPYELGGSAEVEYLREGLLAHFHLPSQHIATVRENLVANTRVAAKVKQETHSARSVLIVEDNLIIAMEAEEIFESLGAGEIVVASTVESALTAIGNADTPFSFALLDINLGTSTSFEIARRLISEKIPFAFASGYGEGAKLPDDLSSFQVLSKPYGKDVIAELVGGL